MSDALLVAACRLAPVALLLPLPGGRAAWPARLALALALVATGALWLLVRAPVLAPPSWPAELGSGFVLALAGVLAASGVKLLGGLVDSLDPGWRALRPASHALELALAAFVFASGLADRALAALLLASSIPASQAQPLPEMLLGVMMKGSALFGLGLAGLLPVVLAVLLFELVMAIAARIARGSNELAGSARPLVLALALAASLEVTLLALQDFVLELML